MECLKVAVELERQRLLVRDAQYTSQPFDSLGYAERLFAWVWTGLRDSAMDPPKFDAAQDPSYQGMNPRIR